jgi:hypothetical protein
VLQTYRSSVCIDSEEEVLGPHFNRRKRMKQTSFQRSACVIKNSFFVFTVGFCVFKCAWDVCAGGACRYSCKERDCVCPIVSKTDKVPQLLLIFSTVKFHEGAFVGSQGTCGRTGRRKGGINDLISVPQGCEHARKRWR